MRRIAAPNRDNGKRRKIVKNLKMMVKLLLGFGLVAAVVLVVAVFGLQGAQKLGRHIREIGKTSMPQVENLMAIDKEMMTVDDAENSLLAPGLPAKLRQDAYQTFDQSKKSADAEIKAFEKIPMTGTEATRWKRFMSEYQQWWSDHLKYVELAKAYEAAPTDRNMKAMFEWGLNTGMKSFDTASKDLGQMIQMQRAEAAATVTTASGEVDRVRLIAVSAMVAGPILAILLGIILALSISRPLVRSVKFAETIAAGDFTHRLEIKQRDEVGTLAAALNEMTGRLSDLIVSIRDSASQVAASSEQIASGTQLMSQDAQLQASTVEETAAAMEELSASVTQVSEHASSQASAVEGGATSMSQVAKSIEEISNSLVEISELAERSVENAVEGANSVREVVEGITLISDSSERIAGIVTIISEISDQTNLLALNASIEAARAGEHGRGFAVVADEVSRLADRSSSSAKEIEALIKESVKNVNSGVEVATSSQGPMEQIRAASQKVKDMIVDLTASMRQQQGAVNELTRSLEDVKEMSESISVATEEQSTNAKQVSKAVENVSELTQRTSAATEEMSSSTEELSSMAQELQSQTAQFRVAGVDQGQRVRSLAGPESDPRSRGGRNAPVATTFSWSDSMLAHINSIDGQRRALVEELNGLHRAVAEGKEGAQVRRLVNHFIDSAGSLFKAEETHSVRSGLGREVPEIHRTVIEMVQNLSESCDGSSRTACLEHLGELKDLFQKHFTQDAAATRGSVVYN